MKKYPKEAIAPCVDRHRPIFSGDDSTVMWDGIRHAATIRDLRIAVYIVCCKLQELESRVDRKADKRRKAKVSE